MKKVLAFLRTPTSFDVFSNTVGNYVNVFFTAFFAWILTRIFIPEQYGVLSVLLGIAYVMANVLDFGTTATIYSYLPPLLKDRGENLYIFIKSTFYYQSVFAGIVVTVLMIFFPYLDKVFFKTGVDASILYITAISILLFIWQNFITNILFAAKKFVQANIYLNIANVIKMLLLMAMILTKTISVGSIIILFGIIGQLVFFALLFMQKKELSLVILKAQVRREEFRFSYALTYFIASQFYNMALRMDLFLLSFYGLKVAVGHYGLAQKIILTIITTIVSVTQVLSPKFSTVNTKHEVRKLLKTSMLYLALPSAIFLALFFTPKFIFALVFTSKFAVSADVTHALSLPFILNALGSAPLLFLLYTVKKPRPILWSYIVFFIIITTGSYLLIPAKGMFGPPIAIFVAFVVTVSMQSWAAVGEYKKMKE